MMHAYSELYLSHARMALGNMLHFAVYDLNRDIEDFYAMFLNSGIAEYFGKGEAKFTVGMSGTELAYEVVFKTTGQFYDVKPKFYSDKSPEYWTGWALAFYEWEKDLPFEYINQTVNIREVRDMYNP